MSVPKQIYEYNASLVRIVDGDTAWLRVDLGFRVQVDIDFRLARINAPEMVGDTRLAGYSSMEHLTKLLTGCELRVKSDKSRDKYGRWIGDIFYQTPDGVWRSASDDMITSGFAAPYGKAL